MNHILRLSALSVALLGWGVVLAVGLVVASPTLVIGPLVGGACTRHAALTARRRRAVRQRRDELIDLVDQLIQRLRAGGSLATIVGEHGSIARTAPSSAGSSDRAADPDQRLVATTLAVLRRRGGPALPSLERLNDTLRTSAASSLETEAQAGQATASALALAALPGLFVVVLASAQSSLRAFYLYDWLGAGCLLAGGALSYTGWAVMQHLIATTR